jgi:predicted  nucleic acid-binding Zn-ribbon protein
MKPSNSLHNTIISEYEKRLKDSAQIIKEIELELGNVTDAKVISELQLAIGDEQVKIKSIEEKLNSLRDYINDSSVKIKVK